MTLAFLVLIGLLAGVAWSLYEYLRHLRENSDRAYRRWYRRNAPIDMRKWGRFSDTYIDSRMRGWK